MAKVLSIRIGTKHVKICELQYGSGNSVFVNRILKAKIPEGAVSDGFIIDFFTAENFLRSIIDENKMTATDVIFSISSSKIATKEIESPIISEKKLVEMIDSNASEYFPIYLEDYILAHTVLDKGNPKKGLNRQRVLVLAAPKELIDDYFQLAERLKLNVKSIDYAGNSAYQMIRRQIGPEPSVVVQVQEETTTVNILSDNILRLQRTIPYGKNLPIQALSQKMHIDEDEAATLLETENHIHETFDGDPVTESLKHLINNVVRVIDYYNSRNSDEPVEKVYLIGESVSLNGLDYLFANEFEVSVAQINRFHGVKLENENDLLHKIVTKYVGCLGAGMASVNFMPKETLEKIKNVNSFRMLKIGVVSALVAGILACAIPVTKLVVAQSEKDKLEDDIKKLESINDIVDDYYTSYDKFTEAKNFKQLTESNNDSIYEFICALEANQASDVAIKSISFSNGVVSISATTSTKETVAQFIISLQSLTMVDDVFVGSISESRDEDGVSTTTFSLTCSFAKIPDFVTFADYAIENGLIDFNTFDALLDNEDVDFISILRTKYDEYVKVIKDQLKIDDTVKEEKPETETPDAAAEDVTAEEDTEE